MIRKAKFAYHQQILLKLKNNSRKLWSNLNNIISSNKATNVPIGSNTLNNYFTSVFKQELKILPNQTSNLPNKTYVACSLFLSPVTFNEIFNTFACISNSHVIEFDGIVPMLVKAVAAHFSQHLLYIVNLSFSQCVFPKSLKNVIVVPVYKGEFQMDPGNYRPISILIIFSKLAEKLFYFQLLSFFDNNNVLHSISLASGKIDLQQLLQPTF